MTDRALQDTYAGAAAAKECSWFTDNPLLQLYTNRTGAGADAPRVVMQWACSLIFSNFDLHLKEFHLPCICFARPFLSLFSLAALAASAFRSLSCSLL